MPSSHHSLRRALACGACALALTIAGTARAQAESDAGVDALASELQGSSGSILSRVQLSGFGDFTYTRIVVDEGSLLGVQLPRHGAFAIGNLNLYVDAPLGRRARSFIEARLTYMPNGVQASTPDRTTFAFPRQSTGFMDYANTNSRDAWGGVVIERAFVEYTLDERLTLRAGHFLTPYGVWNVDHGSPAIVSVQRPYIVGQELIPKAQVGLEAYGAFHLGGSRLGYHATVSNGRIGENPQYLDYDDRLAFGGRLFLENTKVGNLKVGVSAYGGRYTEAQNALASPVEVEERVLEQFDELSLGADVHWEVAGLNLTGEVVWNDRRWKAGLPRRPDASTYDRDARWGAYVVAGYALPFARRVMPYVRGEFFRATTELRDEAQPDALLGFVGVNTHVQPNLIVKVEYGHAVFRGYDGPPYDSNVDVSFAQTSWAF
jgi:hypothetical protein